MSLIKTIVLKPTMACNLHCRYCYESRHNDKNYTGKSFSANQLAGWMERIAKIFPKSRILWLMHGGEPLVNDISFFQSFVDNIRYLNRTYDVTFRFSLQTNGTLLNEDWIQFLQENDDMMSERIVSLSIDGPQDINDIARKGGKKSVYQRVVKAMDYIRSIDMNYTTISVIGQHNIEHPQEIYDFIKDKSLHYAKLIPCYNFNEYGEAEMLGVHPMAYARFVCQIFDCWMHDNDRRKYDIAIDPLITILSVLAGVQVSWCEYRDEKCENFTSIYPDGSLWLCDTYNPDTMREEGYIGNIDRLNDEMLMKALMHPDTCCHYQNMKNILIKSCKCCDIQTYCHSGCLPQRLELKNKSEKLFNEYCRGKHLLINYIKAGMNDALS